MTFDEWFTEIEGFVLRAERFYDDVEMGSPNRMKEWLVAAYNMGYDKGFADGSQNSSSAS